VRLADFFSPLPCVAVIAAKQEVAPAVGTQLVETLPGDPLVDPEEEGCDLEFVAHIGDLVVVVTDAPEGAGDEQQAGEPRDVAIHHVGLAPGERSDLGSGRCQVTGV
jgi:hypothetical protein